MSVKDIFHDVVKEAPLKLFSARFHKKSDQYL